MLKKFTTFWLAGEQIWALRTSLEEIRSYLNTELWIDEPVMRIFHDENERNLWLKKSAEPILNDFLSPKIEFLENVRNPFGCGVVMHSGRLDVKTFFNNFSEYLVSRERLINEAFDYGQLIPDDSVYKDIKFDNIIFCEGIAVNHNPWFGFLPVNANKGHQLTAEIPDLQLRQTVKKKHFLFPTAPGCCYYGGTYDRRSLEATIDSAAVEQLENGLAEIVFQNFSVKEVNVAFRPTVGDRRPILGSHPQFKNLYVFNGLGARGILNGNYFAEKLYRHITHGESFYPEVDVKRFL